MKSLDNFLRKNVLNNELCSNIYGGEQGTSAWTTVDSQGCIHEHTDVFDDLDGDGNRGCNEPGVEYETVTCPDPCPDV